MAASMIQQWAPKLCWHFERWLLLIWWTKSQRSKHQLCLSPCGGNWTLVTSLETKSSYLSHPPTRHHVFFRKQNFRPLVTHYDHADISSVDSCSFNGRRANARSISFVYLLTVVTGHLSSRSTPNIRIFLAHRHGTTCSLESKTFVPWLRTMTMQSEASCYQTQSDCPVFGRTVFYI